MDIVLCDELLHEIFSRLPVSTLSKTSLVSKRWLFLSRSSRSHLSLNLTLSHYLNNPTLNPTLNPSTNNSSLNSSGSSSINSSGNSSRKNFSLNINNFLSYFPFLTSLSISLSPNNSINNNSLFSSLLFSLNPSLRELNIYPGSVGILFLVELSLRCPKLESLSVCINRPFSLYFLSNFLKLKKLSLTFTQNPSFDLSIENRNLNSTQFFSSIGNDHFGSSVENCMFSLSVENRNFSSSVENPNFYSNIKNPNFISNIENHNFSSIVENPSFGSTSKSPNFYLGPKSPNFDVELKLESLTLSCIRSDDYGLDWLYKSSKKLKKLQFRGCEGIGDNLSSSSFLNCLKNIEEVEFRTCRMIIGNILIKIAENCKKLKSLLVYDGGCRDSLLRFIERSNCDLQKLDFRLPLDLDNRHLLAVGEKFRNLGSLRLQSCCLVTGEGLETLCFRTKDRLEELALINCDVAERESGLLTNLGQSLKGLKKLDLSYNETMVDKEFVSMIVSCGDLRELKLRGCRELSNLALVSISKCCKNLECLDIMYCYGIKAKGVELFVSNSPRLRMLKVEESKVSNEVMFRGLKLVHERSCWQ